MALEHVPFSLRSALEESLGVVSLDAEKKGLELICDVDVSVPDTVVGM